MKQVNIYDAKTQLSKLVEGRGGRTRWMSPQLAARAAVNGVIG